MRKFNDVQFEQLRKIMEKEFNQYISTQTAILAATNIYDLFELFKNYKINDNKF